MDRRERIIDDVVAENKQLKAFILLLGIIKVDTTRHRYWKDKGIPICMYCHQGLFYKDDYTDDGYLLDEDCGCILKHDPDNYKRGEDTSSKTGWRTSVLLPFLKGD